MSRTIQPRSWVSLNDNDENLVENKPETEDNKALLLSVFDGLNNLYEKINRLDYILQRKNIEMGLCLNGDNDKAE